MSDRYHFRREDNDKIVVVDWETMMGMDGLGCVELPDGVIAKRVRTSEKNLGKSPGPGFVNGPPIISDSMGFGECQFHEFQEHLDAAKKNDPRVGGVEFKKDPIVPEYYQVHCDSPGSWKAYMRSRGFHDHNSRNGSGAMISAEQLEDAKRLILEKFP
jgi:hypothetical protein